MNNEQCVMWLCEYLHNHPHKISWVQETIIEVMKRKRGYLAFHHYLKQCVYPHASLEMRKWIQDMEQHELKTKATVWIAPTQNNCRNNAVSLLEKWLYGVPYLLQCTVYGNSFTVQLYHCKEEKDQVLMKLQTLELYFMQRYCSFCTSKYEIALDVVNLNPSDNDKAIPFICRRAKEE